MKIIDVINLSKKYHHNIVLDKVNIYFEKGKCYMLVGSNGSGKSTFIKSLLGLTNYNGEIKQNNIKYGYVPEKIILPLNLTINEFLKEISILKGIETNLDETINNQLLTWNLYEKKHSLIKTLSKGMMQKVSIIQSLIIDNDVYIFDEVLNGLDQNNQGVFFNCIAELKRRGKTIIISTHYPKEYLQIVDLVYLVNDRKIKEYDKNNFKIN